MNTTFADAPAAAPSQPTPRSVTRSARRAPRVRRMQAALVLAALGLIVSLVEFQAIAQRRLDRDLLDAVSRGDMVSVREDLHRGADPNVHCPPRAAPEDFLTRLRHLWTRTPAARGHSVVREAEDKAVSISQAVKVLTHRDPGPADPATERDRRRFLAAQKNAEEIVRLLRRAGGTSDPGYPPPMEKCEG